MAGGGAGTEDGYKVWGINGIKIHDMKNTSNKQILFKNISFLNHHCINNYFYQNYEIYLYTNIF